MTEKRASVCVIIRGVGTRKEVLLIKRAVRATDRWSGHIALPGGHRDAGETDLEAAVRETQEEVGLDLAKNATLVSALAPRTIQAALRNRKPMSLHPFVFSLDPDSAYMPLIPQVREVAAAFWYPLEALIHPANKSFVTINVGDRINVGGVLKTLLRGRLGEIMFDAVDIWPTEMQTADGHVLPQPPWKLWGITLNVLHEVLLSTFPAVDVPPLHTPTFTSWDMQFYHYVLAIAHNRWNRGAAEPYDALSSVDTISKSYQHVLPYALGASIAGRTIAFVTALLHIYRRYWARLT